MPKMRYNCSIERQRVFELLKGMDGEGGRHFYKVKDLVDKMVFVVFPQQIPKDLVDKMVFDSK